MTKKNHGISSFVTHINASSSFRRARMPDKLFTSSIPLLHVLDLIFLVEQVEPWQRFSYAAAHHLSTIA